EGPDPRRGDGVCRERPRRGTRGRPGDRGGQGPGVPGGQGRGRRQDPRRPVRGTGHRGGPEDRVGTRGGGRDVGQPRPGGCVPGERTPIIWPFEQRDVMSSRSVRRALGIGAALLVVAALATTAFAGAFGAGGSQGSAARLPAVLPAAYLRDASVDPLVAKRLARRGHVDVLVTLAGASTLSSARASSSGDSRALLRSTVPGYRTLKAGLRTRVPELTVLQDFRTLPVLFVRVDSRAELANLRADPTVIGVGADRREKAFLTQSLPLIGQPAAAAAGFTGAGTAVAILDSGVDYTRTAFGSCASPGAPGCMVVVAQDFAPDDGLRDDPAAGFHGTNVSGIVAGVAP